MADVPKPAADPMRAQWPGRIWRPFPRMAKVTSERDGQAELGVGGNDQPGPAVGLLGGADPGRGPPQGALGEPEGVLGVEAAQVGPPHHVQVRQQPRRAAPPQPQRFVRGAAVGKPLDLDADHRARYDLGPLAAGEVPAGLQTLVQPGPGTHLHPAVAA